MWLVRRRPEDRGTMLTKIGSWTSLASCLDLDSEVTLQDVCGVF